LGISFARVDNVDAATGVTVQEMDDKLQTAAKFVKQVSSFYGDWTAQYQQHSNAISRADQEPLVARLSTALVGVRSCPALCSSMPLCHECCSVELIILVKLNTVVRAP
jgi:hypothetical protein